MRLYNTLRSNFPQAAMMQLELEGSTQEQLCFQLQRALEKLRLPTDGSLAELLQRLADFVRHNKVLLLLDNINHSQQLNDLLPSVFSSGSRIIITSRTKELPSSRSYRALARSTQLVHAMPVVLSTAASKALLRSHHGLSEQHLDALGLSQLEGDVLQACGGWPLALQVIGGALFYGDEVCCSAGGAVDKHQPTTQITQQWKEVHDNFVHRGILTAQNACEARLEDIVALTVEKLSETARHIFLDLVSVFHQPLAAGRTVLKSILEVTWADKDGTRAFKELQ
eukprot:GHUV01015400.1.p1 GENE.GHUV01015400.1~~GHUV01015400.1.p1  ORF type:complete len:282 (+),score=66.62 GHUV01015400.1:158-1003(+)